MVGVRGGVAVAHDEVDDAEDGVEPKGVVNTGDAGGEMTAEGDVWV